MLLLFLLLLHFYVSHLSPTPLVFVFKGPRRWRDSRRGSAAPCTPVLPAPARGRNTYTMASVTTYPRTILSTPGTSGYISQINGYSEQYSKTCLHLHLCVLYSQAVPRDDRSSLLHSSAIYLTVAWNSTTGRLIAQEEVLHNHQRGGGEGEGEGCS